MTRRDGNRVALAKSRLADDGHARGLDLHSARFARAYAAAAVGAAC